MPGPAWMKIFLDDGELTFKCILNKRDFEFYIVW